MAFSSLIFVVVFLPVFLLITYLAGSLRQKNAVLLLFSLVFYAFGGIQALILLVVLALITWGAALRIDKASEKGTRKTWLIVNVVLLLAALGVFKYSNFVLGNVGFITGKKYGLSLALPLGISFYVFKLISYVADVYHERIYADKSFFNILLYAVSFHHVTQGPIIKYEGFREELRRRGFSWTVCSDGITRFAIGLAKKVILADHCGELASTFLPMTSEIGSVPTASYWVGSLCFTLQLYLDFSAYSDMAIGLGKMVGFHYMENFNYPYVAVNVRDFWRRWHISLSQFFRDYIYIPLGGNRVTFGRQILNLLVVWLATGLWHGASWNFILWGLYYFVFVVIENVWRKKDLPKLPRVVGHIYTILVFNFGWILFRFSDFKLLGQAIKGVFGASGNGFISSTALLSMQNNAFFLIFSVLMCTPLFSMIGKKLRSRFTKSGTGTALFFMVRMAFVLALAVLSVFAMAGSTYTPFLYNQF